MCPPAAAAGGAAAGGSALATTQIALTAFSTAIAAYSYYQQGQTAKAAARTNARLAEQAAADAQARGAVEESAHRRRVSQIQGAQRVAIGASGATVDVGTPMSILEDTAQFGELDALTIRNNAAREAFGLRTRATGIRLAGRSEARQGVLGAGGTLVTGAARGIGSYYDWRYGR